MNLLIVTYPWHFYLSQIAAQRALKNLKGINKIAFLWDDLNENQTPELTNFYINQLKEKFQCDVFNFSQFPETLEEKDGWLRQQYVKLQLHKLFSNEHWLVLDGDVIINKSLDVKKFFLDQKSILITSEYFDGYFKFINHALNLKKKNNFSFITPLFLFEREVLIKLEEHCLQLHNKSLIQLFKEYNATDDYKFPTPSFSEFEVYGTFATQVLNKKYTAIKSDFREIDDTDKFLNQLQLTRHNIILNGCDRKEFISFIA